MVGKLAADTAIRTAGTKTANLRRSEEDRAAALESLHVDTARQIVLMLGTMKGAAMKIGQMLSVVEPGLIPAEYRDEFQTKVAELQDSAPKVSFSRMVRMLEEELGRRPGKVFAELDPEPIGSASIGQVYRAQLHDGRDVAVKVQYPGVAAAVRADMKNLALFIRLAKPVAPGLDFDGLSREIRDRVTDELDYALEATAQQRFAEAFEGHPFIVIPGVVSELCSERVLVSEYIEGIGFEAIREQDAQVRDRVGEVVHRFFCGCLYRLGQFSGDPHPGNFRLMGDGRVAFYDFGLYKELGPETVEFELASQRAVAESDAARLHEMWAGAGILPKPELVRPEALLAYARNAVGWYLDDEELLLTPEMATAALASSAGPRSEHFAMIRHQHLPSEHLLSRRTELFTLAILGKLGARGNWHRTAREWLYGDEPATDLGRAEAAFYGDRGRS